MQTVGSKHQNRPEEVPFSCGSYGHPEICGPPCIRAFYSKCTKGVMCEFCHLEHPKPKCKLTKSEREVFSSLDEKQLLSVVISFVLRKCRKLPSTQQDAMRLLLAAIQTRVNSLENGNVSMDADRKLNGLRRLSLGRLFEILQQCQQVDATLKLQVKSLLVSARPALHIR